MWLLVLTMRRSCLVISSIAFTTQQNEWHAGLGRYLRTIFLRRHDRGRCLFHYDNRHRHTTTSVRGITRGCQLSKTQRMSLNGCRMVPKLLSDSYIDARPPQASSDCPRYLDRLDCDAHCSLKLLPQGLQHHFQYHRPAAPRTASFNRRVIDRPTMLESI